jgi:hypothetical protein
VRLDSFTSGAPEKLAVLTVNADVLGDRQRLAPYCQVLADMRSIAASPFPIQMSHLVSMKRETGCFFDLN